MTQSEAAGSDLFEGSIEAATADEDEGSGQAMIAAEDEEVLVADITTEGPFISWQTSYAPGDPDQNLFPSVTSMLSLDLGNLTSEELTDLQFANISCVAEENIVGPSVFASTQLTIECRLHKMHVR